MNRLFYLVTTALATTIGFLFWKVWKSEVSKEKALRKSDGTYAKLEDDDDDEWGDDFIGAPKPIIDPILEEKEEEEVFEEKTVELARELEETESDFAWHIVDYQIPEMWLDTTGENIKVVLLDSGILHTHPDLETVDCKDFVGEVGDATDSDGHGTHCAGIVAAQGIDNPAIIGVAPQIQLYVAKIAESDFDVTNKRVLKGLKWAVRHVLADVVIMSFSLRRENEEIQQLMEDAKDRTLFVGASSKYPYPASYNHCLGIADMDINEDPDENINRYKAVNFIAPGINIASTFTDPLYKNDSGASMATAYVGGILALLKAYAKQKEMRLKSSDFVELLNKTANEIEFKSSNYKIIQPFDALVELKGMATETKEEGGVVADEDSNAENETELEENGESPIPEDNNDPTDDPPSNIE